MTTIRVADIAKKINERLSVYRSALAGDMRRLRQAHGEAAVAEALQLIEQRGQAVVDHWDERGHARAVKVGLMRAIDDHHRAEAEDVLGDALPGSWR
jgi:hypothetical protein